MATTAFDAATFTSAIDALYTSTDNSVKEKARKYTEDFRRSQEGWTVSFEILQKVDPMDGSKEQLSFMAAMTLSRKVRDHFAELPVDKRPAFRAGVFDQIRRFNPSTGTTHSSTFGRLCLLVASLAVQMPDWTDVVKDLVALTGAKIETLPSLLTILEYLVEEAFASSYPNISYSDRRAYEDVLIRSSDDVLLILSGALAAGKTSPTVIQKVFNCAGAWVRYAYIRPQRIVESQLIQAAFAGLQAIELFDEAVELVIEIIRKYHSLGKDLAVISIIVPLLVGLSSKWETALADEDEDTCRGLCRVFSEMGETHINMILGPEDVGQEHLVKLLLRCTAHPDATISSITFRFWIDLSETLDKMKLTPLRDARRAMLTPLMSQLVPTLVQAARFPEDYPSLPKDQQLQFKTVFRFDVSDVLLRIVPVLNVEYIIGQVGNVLKEGLAVFEQSLVTASTTGAPVPPSSWQVFEAALFCVRGLAKAVPDDEAAILPAIMDLLPKLPNHPELRATSYRVIGRYAHWLKTRDGLPLRMFAFLSSTGLETLAVDSTAATDTFRYLCQYCPECIASLALDAVPRFQIARMSSSEQQSVFEGCGMLVTILPAEIKPRLAALIGPLAASLSGLVSAGVAAASVTNASDVSGCLSRMSDVTFYTRVGEGVAHPIVEFVAEMWPVLLQCTQHYFECPGVLEKVMRLLKSCFVAGQLSATPILDQTLKLVLSVLRSCVRPPFIYLLCSILDTFDTEPKAGEVLTSTLGQVAQIVFTFLQGDGIAKFNDNPDVVDDFFRVMIRTLNHLRVRVLSSGMIRTAMQCALAGTSMSHKEAFRSIMVFLKKIVYLSAPKHSDAETAALIGPLLNDFGSELVKRLFELVVDGVEPDKVLHPDGSIALVLYELGDTSPEALLRWLTPPLSSVPDSVLSEKKRVMTDLSERLERRSPEAFGQVLLEVANTCWRRKPRDP